jgi:HK97 gp10 family phage protein
MGSGIDFSAVSKTNIDNDAIMEIGRKKAGTMMKEKAERILDAAKDNAPVDTGALRDSGHIDEKEGGQYYEIIFDAPVLSGDGSYARYVEEGTSKMDAQPYLRPAILAAKD